MGLFDGATPGSGLGHWFGGLKAPDPGLEVCQHARLGLAVVGDELGPVYHPDMGVEGRSLPCRWALPRGRQACLRLLPRLLRFDRIGHHA